MARPKRAAPAAGPARPAGARADAGDEKHAYGAPALEKGLDVLELLAGLSNGVTQSEIAQRLGRSLQEVYRVVMVLERRGFIQRRPGEDGYFLANRLHALANQYPPLRRLVDAARPIMDSASIDTYQALHLAILDRLSIRVVAQVDSPAPLGFRLRVGTQNPAVATASGRLLLAFQPPAVRDWVFGEQMRTEPGTSLEPLQRRIEALRRAGYEIIVGEGLQGITDVSFPILDDTGHALAVLTMPYLSSAMERVSLETATRVQFEAARTLTAQFGGSLRQPKFPLAPIREKRPPARPT
jgi:DNA-binding IclR family transcriptional regulator